MPAQSRQLESVTFDGVFDGMNVSVEAHEIKDTEARYLQDALVFKPGLLLSRGQIAAVVGANVFADRITGLVQTFDSGGTVRIGALTGDNASANLSVLSDDYSSATEIPWTGTFPSSPYYLVDSKPSNASSALIGTSEQYEADSAAQAIGLWKGGTKANYSTGTITVSRGSTSVTGSGTTWSSNASRGMFLFDGSGQLVGIVKTVDSNTAITLEESALVAVSAAAYSLKSVRGINPRVRKGRITCTTAAATVSGQNTKFADMGMGTGTWDVYRARDLTFVGTVTSIQNNTNLTLTANAAVAMDKELFVGVQRDGDYSLSTQATTRKPGFINASYAERQFYANRAGGNGDQVDRLWFSEIGDPEALDLSPEDGDFLRVTTGSARAVNTPIKALASTYNALLVLKENEAFGLFGNNPAQFELKKLGDEGCLSGMSVASYEGGAIWAGREGIYHFDGTDITALSEDNLGDEWKTCVRNFNPQTYRMWGFVHRDHYILHVERVTPGISVTKGVTSTTPTQMTFIIYLPMLSLVTATNLYARGSVTLPASTGHNTWYAVNGTVGGGSVSGYLCSADALFDSPDRDDIVCEGATAGPDFFFESKKYSLGDHMQKKLWKQLSMEYLAAGSALAVDTVVGLNELGATSGSTFPASVYTWDTLSPLFLTWDDLAEAYPTWDSVLDSVFLPKRIKFLKRSTHLAFRLYAATADAQTEVRIGPWALGFKWQRPGRI